MVVKIFLLALLTVTINAKAISMKLSIESTIAGSAICKNYAEEVGGDVEAFSDEMYYP